MGEFNIQEEAEPEEAHDIAPTSVNDGVEGGVSARPQQSRRLPAWLRDFITGGDLDQSFAGNQDNNAHSINRITMAQKQLESPPLELQDMRHLNDDEERKEKRLPGEGLDIS